MRRVGVNVGVEQLRFLAIAELFHPLLPMRPIPVPVTTNAVPCLFEHLNVKLFNPPWTFPGAAFDLDGRQTHGVRKIVLDPRLPRTTLAWIPATA